MDYHDVFLSEPRPVPSGPRRSWHQSSRYEALTSRTLSAVTDELVQRLNIRLAGQSEPLARVAEPPPPDELDAFAQALIAPDAEISRNLFRTLRTRGITPDTLSLDYIAAAARRLGAWWVADECSFLDVTVGSARLHILQRALRSEFHAIGRPKPSRQRALFSPVPGDSHALGVTIAADFFHRAGWHVDLCLPDSIDALCARMRADSYDLVGLSTGCAATIKSLEQTVQCIRAIQPQARMVLGGYVTELEPGLAQSLEIEEVPADITSAPFLLENPDQRAINH